MNRSLSRVVIAATVALVASASAFAQGGGGIGRAGNYDTQPVTPSVADQGGKTRAEVKAELVAAYRDGSLPALNRNAYPNKGLIGETQAERIAAQENRGDATRVAGREQSHD